jgi:flagellin FlaB
MKANQKFVNDRAEVGVGTLIVFIAMVLVAAVAAAVLINTTGSLQQRAQATGKEATQEVSSNLKVVNVYGARNATSGNTCSGDANSACIHKLIMNVELSAGAVPVDLTKLIVRYSDGTHTYTYNYGWQGGLGFNTTWVRGTNNSAVMQSGDLVQIDFTNWPSIVAGGAAGSSELGTRAPVALSLIPESGAPVAADFKTPSTYGTDSTITLR